ncbi:MAG TPA: O-antigen ligase family protein [Candidatus Aquicultor sp.]|jgi:membrane protein CcdC involved in cytochrome C biogenesis
MSEQRLSTLDAIRWLGCLQLALMPIVSLADRIELFNIAGLSIRPVDVLFVLACLTLAAYILMLGKIPKTLPLFLYVLALYALLSLTSFAFLVGYDVDWATFSRFIETMLWGGLALTFIKSMQDLKDFTNNLAIAGSAIGIYSLYLYVTVPGLHQIAGFISYAGGEGLKYQASYNEIGAVHALACILLLHNIVAPDPREEKRNLRPVYSVTLLAFNLIGLALTQSRSAMLAFFATALILSLVLVKRSATEGRRTKRAAVLLILVMSIAITLSYFISQDLTINRFTESFTQGTVARSSIEGRFDLWIRSLNMWLSDPVAFLFGFGNNTFHQLLNATTSDSFFLDHGVSDGLLGLIILLALIVGPVLKIQRMERYSRLVRIALLVTCIALIVSLTGNVLVDPFYGGLTFTILYGALSVAMHYRTTGAAG